MEERELTLLIEFENGIAMRRIVPASALSADREKGLAAEDATRGAAATWGLPDFTFRPLKCQRGPATREAGDVILAVPHRAASVQVKSREAMSDDPVRERKWLDKNIAEAIRQADGTIRTIKKSGGRELTNERGRGIRIGTEALSWARVVVLDHPGLDDYTPSGDAVVLLRRDWEFLFEQLKSVSAVLDYLHRVGTEQIALGTEPMRYYQYALADAAAAPGPLDPKLMALGFRGQSEPILPTKPAGDDGPHIVVRTMLEDILSSPQPSPRWDGFSALALFYITAQAIERVIEPFTGLVTAKPDPAAPPASKAEAESQRALALAQAYVAAPDATQSYVDAAARWQRVVDEIRDHTKLYAWGVATALGAIASGFLGPYLMQAVGAKAVPTWLDVIVTGLIVGGGSKALHDLISKIEKSKETSEDPPEAT